MRFFYDGCYTYVTVITTDGQTLIQIPLYFQNFLNEVIGKYLLHKHTCNISKFAYLRSDYIKILYKAGPYLDYILGQIRHIDEIIYKDFLKTKMCGEFILTCSYGETELKLSSGEIIFASTDIIFCNLLFSCIRI